MSNAGGGVNESVELMKANYERDAHKWNAEKVALSAKTQELEQIIKSKDDEATRREKKLRKDYDTQA